MILFPPTGRKSVEVMKEFRGLSTLDAFTINESYATVAKNLDADSFPAMKVRPSYAKVGELSPKFVGIAGLTREFQNGYYTARLTYGFSREDGKIYTYSYGAIPVWSDIYTNNTLLTNTTDIDYCLFQNDVYAVRIFGSSESGAKQMMKLDGNAVSLITIPAHFQAIEVYKQRLFGSYGNQLFFSNSNLPSDWSTPEQTGIIQIDLHDTSHITALYAGIDGRLLIFRNDSMHVLYGDIPSEFTAIQIATDIGCVNHKSVVSMEGVTYFIDKKGVFAFSGGRPRKISEIVDQYFDNLSWTNDKLAKCSIETDGRRLYVNLGDDVMLVWHSAYNAWYEWNQMNTWNSMYNNGQISFLRTDGYVYEETTIPATITWEWVSKPINTGLLSQRIRLHKLWLTANIGAGFIDVYISKQPSGNSDWVKIDTITSLQLVNNRTVINTNVAANAKVIRLKLAGNRECTIHEILRESRMFPLV